MEIRIIIGYSNLSILLSEINFLDEFKTKKLEIRIKILKKLEKASLLKLSRNIFSVLFGELNNIIIVIRIITEVKLKIKLKLFLIKTPNIRTLKIESAKKISGNKILKLKIIFTNSFPL